MLAKGHLLLVFHAPPKPDELERAGRFFWRNSLGEWSSNDLGTGISALNRHLDQYEDLIAALDRSEEEAKTAEQYLDVLEKLTPLKRSAANLHRVLHDARTACTEYADLIDVRDRAYSIERSADLLFEATRQSLDCLVARRSEEQAHASQRMEASAHRLNLLAGFFFPLVTICAILGVDMSTLSALMQREEGALSSSGTVPFIFLGVIALGMLIGSLLMIVITYSKKT
jgi:hypothetical protein